MLNLPEWVNEVRPVELRIPVSKEDFDWFVQNLPGVKPIALHPDRMTLQRFIEIGWILVNYAKS